jgi:ribosomal protein S18 acetylase RimI-like enzyme
MSDVCIREFRFTEDYEAAIRLWDGMPAGVHVGPSDAPVEIQKKLARDPDLFLVAEVSDRLVGTVIGGFDGRRGMIYHLAVESASQGQGIATRLMAEVEARLRAKGCIRCYLLVMTDNLDAMRYYENRGWSRMEDYPYAKDLV